MDDNADFKDTIQLGDHRPLGKLCSKFNLRTTELNLAFGAGNCCYLLLDMCICQLSCHSYAKQGTRGLRLTVFLPDRSINRIFAGRKNGMLILYKRLTKPMSGPELVCYIFTFSSSY